MADEDFYNPSDVLKAVKSASSKPIQFAFGIGASATDTKIAVDKSKTGEALFAILKKAGAKKGFWGTVSYDGSSAVFTVEKQTGDTQKMLEEHLKRAKTPLKVVVPPPKAAESETPEASSSEPKPKAAPQEKGSDEEESEETLLAKIFTAKELKANLDIAKQKVMHFAFGDAQKPEGRRLALHLHKEGEALGRLVMKETGSTKISFGTVSVKATVATFSCEKDPIPGLKKMLKALFVADKLEFKPVIVGPSGEVNEPGDEDEGTEREGDAASTQPDGAVLERLQAELQELLPMLKDLFAAHPDRATEIRSDYNACQAAIKAGNAAEAGTQLDALQDLVSSLAWSIALKTELDGLLPTLKEMAKLPERSDAIREQWKAADTAIKAGDQPTAVTAMEALRRLAAPAPAAGTPDPNTVEGLLALRDQWADARDVWDTAIETINGQISALQTALLQRDDEDLVAIAEFGLNGVTGNFRNRLTAVMIDLDTEDDGRFRAGAKKALPIITGFKSHIAGDARIKAVDGNPFGVTVSLESTLGSALDKLAAVLQAAA